MSAARNHGGPTNQRDRPTDAEYTAIQR